MDLIGRKARSMGHRWLWAGAALLLTIYVGIYSVIGAGVYGAQTEALDSFPEKGEDALISVAVSADLPLKDRNRAVWVLGQLGDVRALAPLESLWNAEPCDHAVAVCQREVGKAIRQCRGGFNPTRWAWRPFVR